MSASKLIRPDVGYKNSYLEALAGYQAEGSYRFLSIPKLKEDFESFVEQLRSDRGQHQPCDDWVELVPETVLWLVHDEAFLGSVEIRHRLNWHLEKWGGHIHFSIRPSMRGMGFGKKILHKAKPFANYLGLEKALLTVDPENAAAIRVIEFNGGELEDELGATDQFPARKRYWIDCS